MKHRSSRRATRRPVEWIVTNTGMSGVASGTYAVTTAMTTAGVSQYWLLVSSLNAGGAGQVPTVDRFTVMRIKGQFLVADYNSVGAQTTLVRMGVYVGDIVGGTADNWSVNIVQNGDKSWLWQNTFNVNGLGTGAAPAGSTNEVALPHGAQIDIKVKRILRPDQALILATNAVSTAGHSINTYVNLRTLVARAI